MSRLAVQIETEGEWLNLTTVRITPTGPNDEIAARKRAEREAQRQFTGWMGHYPDRRLRIVEAA